MLKTQQWATRQRPPASIDAAARAGAGARAQRAAGRRAHRVPPVARRESRQSDRAVPVRRRRLETGQLDEAAHGAERGARPATSTASIASSAAWRCASATCPKARALLTAYLARQPDDAGAQVDLAKACEALGDRTVREAAYQRALAIAPWLEAAHHGYGQLAGRAGNAGDGFYHLATAARLDGDYTTALNQYARAAPQLPAGDARARGGAAVGGGAERYLKVPTPERRGIETQDEG